MNMKGIIIKNENAELLTVDTFITENTQTKISFEELVSSVANVVVTCLSDNIKSKNDGVRIDDIDINKAGALVPISVDLLNSEGNPIKWILTYLNFSIDDNAVNVSWESFDQPYDSGWGQLLCKDKKFLSLNFDDSNSIAKLPSMVNTNLKKLNILHIINDNRDNNETKSFSIKESTDFDLEELN